MRPKYRYSADTSLPDVYPDKRKPVLADERFGAHFIAYFIYGKAVKGFPNKLSVAVPVPAAAFRLRPVAGGFVHSRGRRKKHGH